MGLPEADSGLGTPPVPPGWGLVTLTLCKGHSVAPAGAGGGCARPGAAPEHPWGFPEHRLGFGSLTKFKSIDDSKT